MFNFIEKSSMSSIVNLSLIIADSNKEKVREILSGMNAYFGISEIENKKFFKLIVEAAPFIIFRIGQKFSSESIVVDLAYPDLSEMS